MGWGLVTLGIDCWYKTVIIKKDFRRLEIGGGLWYGVLEKKFLIICFNKRN